LNDKKKKKMMMMMMMMKKKKTKWSEKAHFEANYLDVANQSKD
jgi:hypothetical protein